MSRSTERPPDDFVGIVCPLCQIRVESPLEEEFDDALRRHFKECRIVKLIAEAILKPLALPGHFHPPLTLADYVHRQLNP